MIVKAISIHAPRVGSDFLLNVFVFYFPVFQSTLPVWGATFRATLYEPDGVFQSTLPVWGATTKGLLLGDPIDISIHAPRVGSDRKISG